MTTVIIAAIAMIIIAAYAYVNVAPGAAVIPMQWSPSGAVNYSWPRLTAFATLPIIGIVALVLLNAFAIAPSAVMVAIALLFVVIQLLHIVLTRRWFAKKRA